VKLGGVVSGGSDSGLASPKSVRKSDLSLRSRFPMHQRCLPNHLPKAVPGYSRAAEASVFVIVKIPANQFVL